MADKDNKEPPEVASTTAYVLEDYLPTPPSRLNLAARAAERRAISRIKLPDVWEDQLAEYAKVHTSRAERQQKAANAKNIERLPEMNGRLAEEAKQRSGSRKDALKRLGNAHLRRLNPQTIEIAMEPQTSSTAFLRRQFPLRYVTLP